MQAAPVPGGTGKAQAVCPVTELVWRRLAVDMLRKATVWCNP